MFQNPRLSCDAEFRIACLDFGIHMFRFACRALVANNTNSEVISNPCIKRMEGWNHMLDLSRAERQRHTHASRSSHSTGTWRTRQLQACGERVEAVFLCTEAEMHKEWRCLLYQHWQSVIRLTFIFDKISRQEVNFQISLECRTKGFPCCHLHLVHFFNHHNSENELWKPWLHYFK